MFHKLALVTVVYKNYSTLTDFFSSLDKQTDKKFKLFIVDLTPAKNKKNYSYPKYAHIIQGENKGFAYGVNLGIRKAIKLRFSQFCVVNNDILLKKDCVEKVNKAFLIYSSSLIGGKIYYAKGYEFHRDRYKKENQGKVIWYAGGKVDWKNAYIVHRGVDEVDTGKYDKAEETDFITGCLMCFDKKVTEKISFWDEKFFLYYEDADYCERAKRHGVKLYYEPSIVIWHKNAQSTGGSGSILQHKYQKESQLRFGLKYAPLRTKLHLLKNMLVRKL